MPAFPANLYLVAAAGAAVLSAASLPAWRAACRRFGLVDDPGHRKIHSTPIPLAGGFAVFTGLAGVLLGGWILVALGALPPDSIERITHGLARRGGQLAALLAGATGMLLLGWWDDRTELPASVKFGGQLLVAWGIAAAGVRVTLFVPNVAFSHVVTVLWILAVTNALNFNDNMNGLCAGLGAIAAAGFAVFAARHDQYLVAAFGFAVLGALLGFLPFNYPRASVFLGDAGSHLVGYLLAVLAMLPHFYSERRGLTDRREVLVPLLVLAVPLADLAQVVVTRTLNRRPFWIGDNNHLSHRLVRLGLSKPAAVLLLWTVAASTALVAWR
ncbi:MAG: undecaprenyl/decaprenyl-phosphate alpha-N-acetylglucosaminyl 1-phosphate transferase [Verrucomicrobia bacterium]|nr:MAG: undecaprenyl/decaprenyl-phosphate alpha-N-acetylglucosaminyl 1-phosphate transferase [Verrucomicrobiota bacterium]